jgi:hypothetical protein
MDTCTGTAILAVGIYVSISRSRGILSMIGRQQWRIAAAVATRRRGGGAGRRGRAAGWPRPQELFLPR